ncbi:hypothetical protein Q5741_02290 [Paenibacillus sp. JX-17]|uniref:Uncharacterized protein n=1 Tax=Paenibacillus lacisoli TaxID=3064525 RepID=A0ABT9C7K7_9BACL|nr:hypothetical protein [Paenibacillus sp. JX-17]MDO7905241.1 hypothetical protein [Paenibacillus sp. JX-17]
MNLKDAAWMTLASTVTGLILSLFSFLKMPYNALLALVALAVIVFYFRRNDSRKLRVGFIIFTVLYFILFIFLISVAQYYNQPV